MTLCGFHSNENTLLLRGQRTMIHESLTPFEFKKHGQPAVSDNSQSLSTLR